MDALSGARACMVRARVVCEREKVLTRRYACVRGAAEWPPAIAPSSHWPLPIPLHKPFPKPLHGGRHLQLLRNLAERRVRVDGQRGG